MKEFLLKVLFWICWLIITTILISLWVWLLISFSDPVEPDKINIGLIMLSSGGTTLILMTSYYTLGLMLYEEWLEY